MGITLVNADDDMVDKDSAHTKSSPLMELPSVMRHVLIDHVVTPTEPARIFYNV